MKQVVILVEGQTEELYVKNVLAPYFKQYNIFLTATIINTKIVKGGNNFKGGINSYNQVKRDLEKLIRDKSILITTFFDFYGLPSDFPGFSQLTKFPSSVQKINFLEQKFFEDVDCDRFIPFIQLHEFEALLFSSIKGFNSFYSNNTIDIDRIENIMQQFPNPEDINDNPHTAPSKRLIAILPAYNKTLQGALIAIENGIEESLSKCPHFNAWVNRIISI